MDDDLDTDADGLSPLQAHSAVRRFAQTHGALPLRLALHAALPQVLHADLLHLLRLNFVDDGRANPVAEADVLFATFCNDLGHSWFRFDPHARAQLLAELDTCYPNDQQHRSQQVAEFLLQHFERELGSERSGTDAMYRSWIEVERWNALAYADPDAAAEQLAQALQTAAAPGQAPGQAAARLRVGALAQTLAAPLVQHQQLLAYAAGVQALQSDNTSAAEALLRRVGDAPLQVGAVVLPGAAQVLQAGQRYSATTAAAAASAAAAANPLAENANTEHAQRPAPQAQANAPAAVQPLPALRECAATAFISYAQADDAAWYGWVGHFRTELERSLAALLRGVHLPRMFMAGESGPVAGFVNEDLRARVGQAFVMIIVVHDHYVMSEWCLQELEAFHALYGPAGLRERLYVVALSQPAMQRLQSQAAWQRLTGGEHPVWMPFFDAADPSRPQDIYMAPGLVSPSFREPFERLRGDLASKLKASVNEASLAAEAGPYTPPASAAMQQPPSAPVIAPAAQPMLAFGLVPKGPKWPLCMQAISRLREKGLHTVELSETDPERSATIMKEASHLVLPFSNSLTTPNSPIEAGPLQLLHQAWLMAGHAPSSIFWLDLRSDSERSTTTGAALWVQQRGVLTLSEDELVAAAVALLQPQGPAPTVSGPRLYIESNRHELNLWETIGQQLQQRWESVCAAQKLPAPPLRCRGLPIQQLNDFPALDDADGVLLLWGKKSSEALVAQINLVEQKLPPQRRVAPGLVLYLVPPNSDRQAVPAWGWPVLRWRTGEGAPAKSAYATVGVLDEESPALDDFLARVLMHWTQRGADGGPGGVADEHNKNSAATPTRRGPTRK